jgi:uncharacterized membrane protein
VSLEAIFLAAFILITENRQSRLADRRARVNLEIDMISEREITKLIQLTREMHDHLGIGVHDQELDNMQRSTNVEHLSQAADSVEDGKPEK